MSQRLTESRATPVSSTARGPKATRYTSKEPSPQTVADPVLRAAYDSILEVGVRRTTLADVARRAGVSRMTVYRKYDDLSRLLSALLTVELAQVLTNARAQSGKQPHARAELVKLVASTSAAVAEHPIMATVLAIDPEALLPLIVDRFGSTQRTTLEFLREAIVNGQPEAGDSSIRAGDPDLMALVILTYSQSAVFSARAIASADPLGHIYSELENLTDRYLKGDQP